jgi:hypothetical protein
MRPRVAAVTAWTLVLAALTTAGLVAVPADPAAAASKPRSCQTSPPDSPGDYTAVGKTRSSGFGIGDVTTAVRLPDGRRLFILGDTLYHDVRSDGRPGPLVGFGNNSAWVQSGNCFTLLDHAAPGSRSWLQPPQTDGTAYWPGGAVVVGDRLHVFLSRLYVNSEFGTPVGAAVATFALPSLELARITKVPFPKKRFYGSGVVYDGGYLYAYASQPLSCTYCFANDMYASRIRESKLHDPTAWEYRTASGWSDDANAARPVLPAAVSNLNVQRYGNGFLLVTKTYGIVDPEVRAWFSPGPTGPWQDLGEIFSIPQPPSSFVAGYTYQGAYTYGPVVLPSTKFAGGTVLGVYNVNSFAAADSARDGRYGIPRFVSISLPPPPAAPPRPAVAPVANPWGPTFGVDRNGRVAGIDGGPSTNAVHTRKAVGIARTPTGKGTWVATADGGVMTNGDARFYGSRGGTHLNQPIVGIGATPTGKGYWLVARDGGIFTFGDAKFYGSAGAIRLRRPILSMQTTPTGKGYWLVASDGGIFTYGDAKFRGSGVGIPSFVPFTGLARTPNGRGYWLVNLLGQVYAFGDAARMGDGPMPPKRAIVGIIAMPGGYRLVDTAGYVYRRTATPATKRIPIPAPLIAAT